MFIQKIKTQCPDYYNLKYDPIFKPLDRFEKSIPPQAALIEYFFIGKKPYAIVVNGSQKLVYELNIA